MEWEDSPQEGDRHDHRLLCIPPGMGSLVQGTNHRGSMVSLGSNTPHQLSRTSGGNSSSAIIWKGQMRSEHPANYRQHLSSFLHKPPGGNSLQRSGESDQEPMDVVPREEHAHNSPTPPRVPEHHRRCRILVSDRPNRLEAEPFNISQDTKDFRPTGSGPLCDSPVYPVPSLLQLAARSICRSNRCISPSVDSHQGVCQPTLEPGKQDTHPSTEPTSHHNAGSTSLEIPTVVPYTPTHADRLSKVDINGIRNDDQQGQFPGAPSTSRMAHPQGEIQKSTAFGGSYRPHAQFLEA